MRPGSRNCRLGALSLPCLRCLQRGYKITWEVNSNGELKKVLNQTTLIWLPQEVLHMVKTGLK